LPISFEDIILAVEILHFLALRDKRADAGLRIEAGDARAPRAAAFGERALRAEFDFEFAREILPLELLVLADIGGDHLPDLLGAEQLAEPFAVDPRIVAGDRQLLGARVADRVDQPLGNA